MQLNEALKWRYATKKFDPAKKLDNAQVEKIKEAFSLSASSYGLQMYKAVMVNDPEVRKQMVPISWGQKQVEDASHLIVLASHKAVSSEDVDHYVDRISEVRGMSKDNLSDFSGFIKTKMEEMPSDAQAQWLGKQTYIGLGNILAACAELQIDSCPMEGFEVEKVNELLGLDKLGLSATVLVPIGYRSEDDPYASLAKVRKPENELFLTV